MAKGKPYISAICFRKRISRSWLVIAYGTPLILALWRQRQMDMCVFEVSQSYIQKPCLREREGKKKTRVRGSQEDR